MTRMMWSAKRIESTYRALIERGFDVTQVEAALSSIVGRREVEASWLLSWLLLTTSLNYEQLKKKVKVGILFDLTGHIPSTKTILFAQNSR